MKQERMCLSTFSRSILFHMVQFPMKPKKPPDIATRGIQVIHAAITSLAVKAFTQFLLSSRLYCRFWNYTRSAVIKNYGRSRTIPPVGNYTPPRRTYRCLNYSTSLFKNQEAFLSRFSLLAIQVLHHPHMDRPCQPILVFCRIQRCRLLPV